MKTVADFYVHEASANCWCKPSVDHETRIILHYRRALTMDPRWRAAAKLIDGPPVV